MSDLHCGRQRPCYDALAVAAERVASLKIII